MIDVAAVVGALGAVAAFIVPAALTQLRVAREIGSLTSEIGHLVKAMGAHREVEIEHDRKLYNHETRLTIIESDVHALEQHHKH